MIVDLRSDTVTRPTPEMYEAMARAPLGDDVLGDEPTVAELERVAAERMAMEAAVFVPSGTMGNQIALAAHTSPGDAVIFEEEAHMLFYECGAPAVLSGVVSWTVPSERGIMAPEAIERRILVRSLHSPGTTVVCIENTHNRAGGTIIPLTTMAEYRVLADKHGLKVHLDGARVFNAAVSLGVPVSTITQHVDSVSFCLSKGLSSPVGSVLCGPADFIERARQWRKRVGGGMRQSGILAACGLVSLNSMVDRLAEDHRRAKDLASGLQEISGLRMPEQPETNIVMVETAGPAERWTEAIQAHDVWAFPFGANRIRLVLHKDIDDAGVEQAIDAFRTVSKA